MITVVFSSLRDSDCRFASMLHWTHLRQLVWCLRTRSLQDALQSHVQVQTQVYERREERLRREDEWNLLGRKWFHYRAKMGYATSRRRWIRFADAIAQLSLVLFTKIFLDKRFEIQTIKESDNVAIETWKMQKAKPYLFKIVDEDEDEFSHTCNFRCDGVLDFIFD